MKKCFIFLSFIILFLVSCTGSGNVEAFVQDRVLPNMASADNATFHMMSVRTFPEGTIALYSTKDANQINDEILGYAVLEKGVLGWKSNSDGAFARDKSTYPSEQLIDYASAEFYFNPDANRGGFTHVLLYGEILSPEVTAVNLLLSDGTEIEDNGEGGVFALPVPKGAPVCELQVMGQDGKILQTISSPELNNSPAICPAPAN